MKKITLLTFLVASCLQAQVKSVKIKPVSKIDIKIAEPSDICLNPSKTGYFIVGDGGELYETDLKGNIIRKADFQGMDCEGVHADENFVYVAEEFSRKVKIFDVSTLKLLRTVLVAYNGGRNKAYEGITYNAAINKFILVTEKSPIYLFELDNDFRVTNEINLNNIAKDVSAITYYNNSIWLLSDESMAVFRLNPNDYTITGSWKIPVHNPEGLTFDNQGNMIVLSDDMQKIYQFANPEIQQ